MTGRYLLSVCASAVMTTLALAMAPLLPLFADERGWLPSGLWWFQTPDNSLDGDKGFRAKHAPYEGVQIGWRRYLNRVAWLLRNPAYGFDWLVLAVDTDQADLLQVEGDPATSNIPGHSGTRVKRVWRADPRTRARGLVAWEWYYVRQWGQSPYCVRVRLGWKIPDRLGQPATFVCSGNPLMGFES